MKDDLKIGNRIRSLRKDLNFSRQSFAKMIHISESFLSKIETGNKSISIDTLIAISQKTGASTDYILFGEKEENKWITKISKTLANSPEKALSLTYKVVHSICSYANDKP